MSASAPQPARLVSQVDEALRQRVLRPYLPHCRYVQKARLSHGSERRLPQSSDPDSWLRLDAECGIDDVCYIEATGHFNAVELNITYNQMLYLCLADSLRRGLLPAPAWSLDDFFRHQLPDVLIAEYSARFRRPMQSHRFRCWMAIESVLLRPHRNMALMKTRCGGSNDGVDACEAQVTIALVDWPSA
ncbi:MAG TPA: FcoT family thioesterase [Planctomycetota bacterium]|nr:FcoT family thioesterase [Planctomycetota bacterium]